MLPVMFLERARRKEQDDRLISSHYLMKLGLDIIIASYGKGVSHDDRFIYKMIKSDWLITSPSLMMLVLGIIMVRHGVQNGLTR